MGFKSLPFNAVQGILHAEEVVPRNCPSLPWVAKYQSDDNVPAADVFIYFDDCRTMGNSEQECWAATRRVGSIFNWLGVQDAP
jgi:hypothetical protein